MAKPKTMQAADDRSAMELEIEKKRSAGYLKELTALKEQLKQYETDIKDKTAALGVLQKKDSENRAAAAAQQEAASATLRLYEEQWTTRQAQLTAERAQVDEQIQKLKKRESFVQEREAQAVERAAQCEEYEKKLIRLRVEHGLLKEEAAGAQRTLAQSRAELGAAVASLEKREGAAGLWENQLADRERKVAEVENAQTAEAQKLKRLDLQSQERQQTAGRAAAAAAEEVLRAEQARLDRAGREAALQQRERVAELRDGELMRRKQAIDQAEDAMREQHKDLAQARGEMAAQRAAVENDRAALAMERADWEATTAARLRQAEADERNARSSAIAESQHRCAELEARAREQYEAHIKTAQDRARDLEAAAQAKHDELIAAALKDDEGRRGTFAKQRDEKEAAQAQEAERRLARANQEAAKIEATAAAKQTEADQREAQLAQRAAAARAKAEELETKCQDVAELQETLDRRKKRLDEYIAAEAGMQLQPLQAELLARNARIEKIEQMLRSEVEKRTELDALIAGSGGDTVPRLKQLLEVASGRVATLEQQLREIPRTEDVQRLRDRAELAQSHEQAAAQLRMRVAQLENLRARSESDHVQHAGERAVAETLRATNQALRQELDHLKALVDQQVANPLQAFQEVYQNAPQPTGQLVRPKSLDDLAQRMRYRMATLPDGRARYYSDDVVARYLGALSATRVLLLEGLSGTGKTSLPVAVAEAMGAGCEVIEVQSQWRDRGDLVGSYNPFHKRFYAQPFALALYRAGLPGYRERPFFIVLDELNLSHVEHYFADVLSLLERDPREHRLRLVDDPEALARAPFSEGLVKDPRFGWSLEIPPNVWFIGTANRDESTRPISDKVYDRAMVLELNHRAKSFPLKPQFELLDPIGWKDLMSIFNQAAAPTPEELAPVASFLEEVVGKLEQNFRITRTNRFEKQWKQFLPVYLSACRGAMPPKASTLRIGEALDHFLATKLLRPLKERFDPNLEDMLRELRNEDIPLCWEKQWGEFETTQSYQLLDEQLRKRQSHGR